MEEADNKGQSVVSAGVESALVASEDVSTRNWLIQRNLFIGNDNAIVEGINHRDDWWKRALTSPRQA